MRIGIFGGAFSPPHKGHIAAALCFIEKARLDKLVVVPSLISPHKQNDADDDPYERLKLAKLAFADIPNTVVSDVEIKNGGVSYTYLTLEHFYNGEDTLCLLVGSDMFMCLDKWKEAGRIFSTCEIYCHSRQTDDRGRLDAKKAELERRYNAVCHHCENTVVEASSTQIRRLLIFGEDASAYVTTPVMRYVAKNDIYGAKNAEIREYIKTHLTAARYGHSVRVAQTAYELGSNLGMTEKQLCRLVRAGYLHDIAKELSLTRQASVVLECGADYDPDYVGAPQTFHQLSGACLAKRLFDIDNGIFRMIQYHCTGAPDMDLSEKIIYLSDFIEPGRTHDACVKMRERVYSEPITEEHINAMFFECLKGQLEHLKSKEAPVHGLTSLAYETEVLKNGGK